jgi:hypothetical protein
VNGRLNSVTLVSLVIHYALQKKLLKEFPLHKIIKADENSQVLEKYDEPEGEMVEAHASFIKGFFEYLSRKRLSLVTISLTAPYVIDRDPPKDDAVPRLSVLQPFSKRDMCLAMKKRGVYDWVCHCIRVARRNLSRSVCPASLGLTREGKPLEDVPTPAFIEQYEGPATKKKKATAPGTAAYEEPTAGDIIHIDGIPVTLVRPSTSAEQ